MPPQIPSPRYAAPPMGQRRALSIADLILRRGDVAARGHLASGQAWGNTIGQLGDIASQTYMGYTGQKEEEKAVRAEEASRAARTAAFAEILKDPKVFEDGQYAFGRLTENGLYDPEPAIKLAQAFQTFGQAQGERDPEKAMKHVPTLAAGYAAADDATRPMLRGPLQTWLSSASLEPEGGWQGVSDEDFLRYAQAYAQEPEEVEAKGYPVTVPGPKGPVRRLATEAELKAPGGVPLYERPRASLVINPQRQADVDENARAVNEGRMLPGFLSKRGKDFNAIFPRASRMHEERTGKPLNFIELQLDYEAAKTFVKSLNGPQMTRFRGLARSVVNTIDEVHALAKKLKQGGIKKWNRVKRDTLLEVYGNTAYSRDAVKYLTATNTLKDEFAGLVQGGYAPTGPAWDLAHQMVNADYGIKDLDASLVEVQRLINYRMGAFEELTPWGTGGEEGGGVPEPLSELEKDDLAQSLAGLTDEQFQMLAEALGGAE